MKSRRLLATILVSLLFIYTCTYNYKTNDKHQPCSDIQNCEKADTEFLQSKHNEYSVLKEETNYFESGGISSFMKRQALSRNSLKEYCDQNAKELPRFEDGFSSIIVDSVDKLTYCPVYKIASTSWALTLIEMSGEHQNEKKRESVRDTMDRIFKKVPHIEGPQETESTIKFMIVRHPFERLLSAYRDKFENAKKFYFYKILGGKMVRLFRSPPPGKSESEISNMLRAAEIAILDRSDKPLKNNIYSTPYGPTFKEFVEYVVTSEFKDDDHWRPIYIQCSLCYMEYDFTLRFENLEYDSNSFIEYLNKSQAISPRWENPTSGGKTDEDLACKYFSQLPNYLGEALVDKYFHDLNMFHYSPDKYLDCINM